MEIDQHSSPLLLSQWKSYSNIEEIEKFITSISEHPTLAEQLCFIALPTPLLRQLSKRSNPEGIVLGAKSMDSVTPGTFTEVIAIPLLKRANAKFVLIGSYESRHVLHETNDSINLKIHKLLEAGIQPVLCIGETSDEKKQHLSVKVLTEQLQAGLKGFTAAEQAQVIILYEATSMLMGTKKYTSADCQQAYDNCEEALKQVLPEEILAHMRVIYTFPNEPIEYRELIEQNPGIGFYSATPDYFFPLLDSLSTTEHSSIRKPFIHKTHTDDNLEIESPLEEETLPSQSTFSSSLKGEELENKGGEDEEHEEGEIRKGKSTSKSQDESSFVEDAEESTAEEKTVKKQKRTPAAPYSQHLTEPSLEEPAVADVLGYPASTDEKVEKTDDEVEETEDEIDEEDTVLKSGHTETAETAENAEISAEISNAESEEVAPTENSHFSASPEEPLPAAIENEIIEEELPLQVSKDTSPIADSEPNDSEENDFESRIADLQRDGAALEEMYTTLVEKAKRMNELRKNYPIFLDKVTHELNLLDPDLQNHISQGNLEFFKDHPELFERAQSTFVHIQNLNEVIVEAGKIPREIDRLKSQSKKLREKLQNNWDFLNAHRLEMKKIDPEQQFPAQPKALQSPPPEIDLTLPATPGPSPLLQKRIGVVKKSKKSDTKAL